MQWRKIPLLVLALLAAGCGRDAVAGGYKEVETVAVGDGDAGGSASRAPAGARRLSLSVPQGTLTFVAAVSLVAEDGGPVPVTDGARTVQLTIDGRESFAEARVLRTRYARVRVVFTRVEADVTGGLLGITGLVKVGIAPGGSLVVERDVPLADADRRDTVVVDLNASAWLAAAVAGTVPAPVFESAVRIRAE